jgi:hypothetical protein
MRAARSRTGLDPVVRILVERIGSTECEPDQRLPLLVETRATVNRVEKLWKGPAVEGLLDHADERLSDIG